MIRNFRPSLALVLVVAFFLPLNQSVGAQEIPANPAASVATPTPAPSSTPQAEATHPAPNTKNHTVAIVVVAVAVYVVVALAVGTATAHGKALQSLSVPRVRPQSHPDEQATLAQKAASE